MYIRLCALYDKVYLTSHGHLMAFKLLDLCSVFGMDEATHFKYDVFLCMN